MEENLVQNTSEMQLTEEMKAYLSETAKWAQFLSILGFLAVGFLVLIGVITGVFFEALAPTMEAEMEQLPSGFGGMMAVFYVVVAVLYFFPVYYQLQFANKMRTALNSNDNAVLALSFSKLKSFYKFTGIMAIVLIAVYLLLIVGVMFTAAAA